jgi:hypothetical protein
MSQPSFPEMVRPISVLSVEKVDNSELIASYPQRILDQIRPHPIQLNIFFKLTGAPPKTVTSSSLVAYALLYII